MDGARDCKFHIFQVPSSEADKSTDSVGWNTKDHTESKWDRKVYLNFQERAPETVVLLLLLLLEVSSSSVKSGSSGEVSFFVDGGGATLLCLAFSSVTSGIGDPGATPPVPVGWLRSAILMSPFPAELLLIMFRNSAKLLPPFTFIRPIIFLRLTPDMLASSSSVGSSSLLLGVAGFVDCVVVVVLELVFC